MADAATPRTRFGPYELVRHLGSRPDGQLVRRQGEAKRYLLHLVTPPPRSLSRARVELSRYALLTHPGIEKLVDVVDHEDTLALVFDRLEGIRLDHLKVYMDRDRVRLPDRSIWYLAWRVLGALAEAHAVRDRAGRLAPLVHGTISPRSVLVSPDGDIYLLGLCPYLRQNPELELAWRAPELSLTDPPSAKADTYALAKLVRSLLTGQAPEMATPGSRQLGALRRDIPTDVARAFDRALDEEPGGRPSCAELAQRLGGLVIDDEGRAGLRERMELYRALWGLWNVADPPAWSGDRPVSDAPPTSRPPPSSIPPGSVRPAAATQPPPDGESVVADSEGQDGQLGSTVVLEEAQLELPHPSDPGEGEVGELESEVGEPESEVGDRESEVGEPKSEVGEPKSESEDRGRRAAPVPVVRAERPAGMPAEAESASTWRWIALAATAVAAAAVIWTITRGSDPPAPPSPTPTASIAQPAPLPTASQRVATAEPATSARAAEVAKPPAKSGPRTLADDEADALRSPRWPRADVSREGVADELFLYQGYLVVSSSIDADVTAQGANIGRTNRRNKLACGHKFVRLTLGPGRWVSDGVTVRVACRAVTTVKLEPNAALLRAARGH